MFAAGFGIEGRGVGRAVILGVCEVFVILGFTRAGEGSETGLDEVILGAGAGMYCCFSPPESETTGTLLAVEDGVRIPLDSPTICGLSSQTADGGFGGVWMILFSNGLSNITAGGGSDGVMLFSPIMMGG